MSETRRKLYVFDKEQPYPFGKIIDLDGDGYFALEKIISFPFKVGLSNVLPWSITLDYYADSYRNYKLFNFKNSNEFEIKLNELYPESETLYLHMFHEVFF